MALVGLKVLFYDWKNDILRIYQAQNYFGGVLVLILQDRLDLISQ